jgi:hypothetical protein
MDFITAAEVPMVEWEIVAKEEAGDEESHLDVPPVMPKG